MKFLLLASYLPSDQLGGTEVAVYSVAKELARRGIETHVIARSPISKPYIEQMDGFWVHRVRFFDSGILRASHYFTAFLEAIKIQPDCIMSFRVFPNGLLAVLLGKIMSRLFLLFAEKEVTFMR